MGLNDVLKGIIIGAIGGAEAAIAEELTIGKDSFPTLWTHSLITDFVALCGFTGYEEIFAKQMTGKANLGIPTEAQRNWGYAVSGAKLIGAALLTNFASYFMVKGFIGTLKTGETGLNLMQNVYQQLATYMEPVLHQAQTLAAHYVPQITAQLPIYAQHLEMAVKTALPG